MPQGHRYRLVVPCFCALLWIPYVTGNPDNGPSGHADSDPDVDLNRGQESGPIGHSDHRHEDDHVRGQDSGPDRDPGGSPGGGPGGGYASSRFWLHYPDVNEVSLPDVDSRTHWNRNGMIDYVIHRGCSYMSVYVRSHYMFHHSYYHFAPSHDDSSHDAPSHDVPSHDDTSHDAPSHNVSSHDDPSHDVPYHNVPSHDAPSHDVPSHDVPSHDDPSHDVPASSDTGACSWEQYIGMMCDVYHIPHEFREALLDCGQYSTSGLHIDIDSMHHGCQISQSAIIGKRNSGLEPDTLSSGVGVATGRQHEVSESLSSGLRNGFRRRHQTGGLLNNDGHHITDDDHKSPDDTDDHHSPGDDHDDKPPVDDHHDPTDHRSHGPDAKPDPISADTWSLLDSLLSNRTVPTPALHTWCQSFSRKIRDSHHLSRNNFRNSSNHWILDVYRVVNKYQMPKYYAHSLVGCGLRYVLYAFHVPLWQTLAYISQLH